MMPSFPARISWAMDVKSGRLIRADRAERKPGRGCYRCLDDKCKQDLTVARSKRGRLHFRHFRNSNEERCAFHGLGKKQTRHEAAKFLLSVWLSHALKRRTPMPLFLFNTPAEVCTVLPYIGAGSVVTEWQCPLSDRRADIAILDGERQPVLLIEVFHTHAVDIEKCRDLSPYWWIEVEANQVLADPTKLMIINHGNLPECLAPLWQQFDLFSPQYPP